MTEITDERVAIVASRAEWLSLLDDIKRARLESIYTSTIVDLMYDVVTETRLRIEGDFEPDLQVVRVLKSKGAYEAR